jgi:hypothetical protein
MKAIHAASVRAEAAASRAEVAAATAEAAAGGAFKSCYRTNRTLIETARSLSNTKDYIDRFAMWEKIRKLPQHRDPREPKPGTILPDGSMAATFLQALAVSPHAYDHSPAEDPRDREDDDHATAVMNCHPELRNLPMFMGAVVGADWTGGTKTKDGRDASVIMVEIDDTDPHKGAATLAKAHADAPAVLEDVPVSVYGVSSMVFYPADIPGD